MTHVVTRALEANLWSMWSQFGSAPGATLHDEDGALWFETPIAVPPYNMVIRFHGDAEADAAIDRVVGRFRARRVPLLWFVHPSSRPADLRDRLAAHGLVEVDVIAGMVADLRTLPPVPPPPADVKVRELGPGVDASGFLEFVATRWNVPAEARTHLESLASILAIGTPGSPNRAWVVSKGGETVAKVFTHEADGQVGLYGMATRPEARGLGLGRLLCITALAAARERGLNTAVLHATARAVPLYERVGFRAADPFSLWTDQPSFHP